MKKPTHFRREREPRGFSLIITISMMVLLSLLAVGLLGLSTISLRSSRAGDAMAEARANARLALTLAIGDLQKSLGPDQRISARSSVVNGTSGEANLVGAWESWRWNPMGADGPSYSDKKDRFLRWLASTGDPADATDRAMPGSAPDDPIWLVNPETTGQPASGDDVGPGLRAGRVGVEVNERTGGFAWAVMDESQKAPINLPFNGDPREAEIIAQRTAPQRPASEVLVPGLDPELLGDPQKLISLDSAVLALGDDARENVLGRQQVLSPQSVGLLTNVAEGGLRTDLTTLFEGDADLANVLGAETPYFTMEDGAPNWEYLRSHYQLHQRVRGAEGGAPEVELSPAELRPGRTGIDPSPTSERLMPVIAKLQIMFSVVTHYSHIGDRVNFFNTQGNPRGNQNYGAPHLVYDPVVTLWNPYDVAIELRQLRVRIWDPPVVFGFKKNNQWLRPEHGSGDYHGLARFQIANEKNPDARRYFTMLLRESSRGGRPGAPIKLQPGEVRIFSPWVEEQWTWGYETQGGYNVRAFFDWNAGNDFGNRDGRTNNQLGIECIPGWDPRAGLQTDHLAYADRPSNTRYDFELQNNWNGGWLGIKLRDTFGVHARPERALPERGASAREPDFKVDVLAGLSADPTRDILRTYQFRFRDVASEIGSTIRRGEIARTFRVNDILQTPADRSPGGKSPFAILTMGAKTTIDPSDISKPWVSNHPVHEGAEQDTRYVGNALDTYDLRFEEVADFNTFPGVEWDPTSNRGFFGASSTANRGVTNVPMFHVPLIPASSLGDLVTSNLVAGAALPRVTHAFGNSRANPLLPTNAVSRDALIGGTVARFGSMLDHSYLLNDALWDRYYFSTIASYNNALAGSESRGALLEKFLDGDPERRPLNPRLIPVVSGEGGPEALAQELDGLGEEEFSRRIASVLGVEGAFNVNCDSVEAWRAFLSSAREAEILGWGRNSLQVTDKTGFPRQGLPLSGDADAAGDAGSIDIEGQRRWAGFRALDDNQIKVLAESIVEQIRERGSQDGAPSLTIGEFANRRVGAAGGLHVLQGLLQRASADSGINEQSHGIDSKVIDSGTQVPKNATAGAATEEARYGPTGDGAPSVLTQGDLMMALAPVITVRGDTFRIRAYGESRDAANRVTASAWCEAVVQRVPDYLDSSDEPELTQDQLRSEANQQFGRRFILTSFRWLSPEEV